MSDFKMPYQTYGKNDYETTLERENRNRTNNPAPSTEQNFNKNRTPTFNPNPPRTPRNPTSSPRNNPRNPTSPRNPRNPRRPTNRVPPQPGLVPIGNTPFYATPNEPIDPRDCARYSNSPWCGRPGFRPTKFMPIFNIVEDECNIGIEISPTLGYVALPDFQLVYRKDKPECRIPPPIEYPIPPEFPPLILPSIDPEAVVYVWLNIKRQRDYYYIDFENHFNYGGREEQWSMSYSINWSNFECPGRETNIETSRGEYLVKHLLSTLR